MKKEFYFHIPQPCHEDWDKMTPGAKGRFCESCSKNVVDFSLMTDNEVLNYFKNNTGKVCGRFANDQLQRPFIPAKETKKKTGWVAMMMPFMLLGKQDARNKNGVEQNITTNDTISHPARTLGMTIPKIGVENRIDSVTETCEGVTLGSPAIEISDTSLMVSDVDIEESDVRMIGDTIMVVHEKQRESNIDHNDSALKETDHQIISSSEMQLIQDSTFHRETADVSQIVIVAGGISSYCKIKKADTLKTSIRKIFRTEFFKLYPNPAPKGGLVHLQIKKAGKYSIQFFDNNSRLILVQDFSAVNDNAVTNISIPSSLAAGIYYVRVLDEEKKKQYVDKILVE